MRRYIYNRVSTEKQDYEQQMEVIRRYLEKEGIGMERITAKIDEKVTGGKDPGDRKLKDLLDMCDKGDVIYVSEQSRLCRSLMNSLNFMRAAGDRGVTVICCKEEKRIDPDSIEFVLLSWLAEQERKRIQFNTSMGLAVRKRWVDEGKQWVSKSGKPCTRLGSPSGEEAYNHDMSAANKANARRAALRRAQSPGYKLVAQMMSEGKTHSQMLKEFNRLHELSPDVFCAPSGGPMTSSCLVRWRRYILQGDDI